MKRTSYLAATLILATSVSIGMAQVGAGAGAVAGTARAGAGAGGGGAGAGRGAAALTTLNRAFYTTELDTMATQLTLTDDQKTKLQDKISTMNKELDAFLVNAQPQIAAARRGARAGAAAAGRAGTGVGGVLAGNPTVLKLQDDMQLLANEHQVLINQALTPEQRIQWETYKLTRVLDPRVQSLGLTDDQKDKVKALVDETAKALAALTDGKTVQPLQGQLFRKLIGDVLTDAQAGKLMEGPLAVQGAAAGVGAGAGGGGGGGGAGVGGAARGG